MMSLMAGSDWTCSSPGQGALNLTWLHVYMCVCLNPVSRQNKTNTLYLYVG